MASELSFESVADGRTNGRTIDGQKVITKAHPDHSSGSSGELINLKKDCLEKQQIREWESQFY